MTPQERKDLLERVAAVAPKEMEAKFVDSAYGHCVAFGKDREYWGLEPARIVFGLQTDDQDAEATVAMIEFMRKSGQRIGVYPDVTEGWTAIAMNMHRNPQWQGGTASEAVARAFVAVFSATSNNSQDNKSTQGS